MPTQNPRITITLHPEVHAVLRRISALTGESQSAFVSSLLKQSLPMFQRMVTIFEAAELARTAIKADVVASLQEAQTKVEGQLGLMLETVDDGVRPLLEVAEAIERRAGRRPARGGAAAGGRSAAGPSTAPTPLSNRGVTPQHTTRKAAKSTAPVTGKPTRRRAP